MEGKGQNPQPGSGHRQIPHGHSLIAVPEHTHIVGDEDLFPQAHHKHLHTGGEFVHGGLPAVNLIAQILILNNWAGNELREEGNKGTKIDNIPLSPGIPPVHIDGVAHGLEGVKGDADGKMDVQYRHKGETDCLEGGGQKVPVLEEQQQS